MSRRRENRYYSRRDYQRSVLKFLFALESLERIFFMEVKVMWKIFLVIATLTIGSFFVTTTAHAEMTTYEDVGEYSMM